MSKYKSYYVYGILYLIFSLYIVFLLRFAFTNGLSLFIFVTIICILTDLGGFIFGKIFQGPKLIKYSPNKTYSGLLGSFVLSFCIIPINFIFDFINGASILSLAIFTFIVSGTSQLGDIFISYFKRVSKIKDTGNIIPGHGGLLDRIDGMIFAFPLSYFLILINFLGIFK
ncbi:phosphatidate cytidylyltransferase [Candidatus Pelagibacter sp. HIMB1495]|uniref:phosphatidate cytidylyltransferase n=1 Tax=unclassified Candidatus Pelagibacter TaxID=2647897 RepID=UPI003F84D038